MSRTTTVRFQGGPLGGRSARKTAPARPALYLDDAGETIAAPKGDRIIHGRSTVRSCYVLTDDDRNETEGRTLVYSYRTAE